MIVRDFQSNDLEAVKEIFSLYWNDPDFLKELLNALHSYINQNEECKKEKYTFLVAEENGEVVGVAGFRSAPEYLREYTKTDNPAELYIIAAKYKNKGIGKELGKKRIEEIKHRGFTEIVLYSPDSHEESWDFHDAMGFERVGEVIAPDGFPGQAWRKIL